MRSDEEMERISKFVSLPGFQFSLRLSLHKARMINALPRDSKYRTVLFHEYANESNFLRTFSLKYEFYRYVRNRELTNEWYWNQVRTLTYLVILDLLHPEKAYPTETEKIKEIEDSEGNTSSEILVQNFQRTKRTYPELFFKPIFAHTKSKGLESKRPDRKISRYSTIFSEMGYIGPDEDVGLSQEMMSATFAVEALHSDRIEFLKEEMACFRMVDVNDMKMLVTFWEIVKHSLDLITRIHGEESEKKWLIEHFRKGSTLIEALLNIIDQAVSLQWYRKIKTKNAKQKLFEENHPIRFSKDEAAELVQLCMKWFDDEVKVVDLILRGVSAYRRQKNPEPAIFLLTECLNQLTLEKEDEGLCYHNMAIVYRTVGKPRKSLIALLKAKEAFELMNSPYDIGITWAHISVIYHILGNKQKERTAKRNCNEILNSHTLAPRRTADAYIYVADCAREIHNFEWEKEASNFGLRAGDKIEDEFYSSYFNQRLTALEKGIDTLEFENAPFSIKRPPVFRWDKKGGAYIADTPVVIENERSEQEEDER